VVPRKFVPGVVPLFPVSDHAAGAVLAIVSVCPDGVIEMFVPAANPSDSGGTASSRLWVILPQSGKRT
jgi:hypothetical protein